MTTILLPLNHTVRIYAAGLLLGSICLSLLCQIAWPLRLAVVAVLVLTGALLWRRHVRCRPAGLVIGTGGQLRCMLADGRSLEIARILPGIIRPSLVSARLEGRAGQYCDLFVPGNSLPDAAHWELRRALIGFRPIQRDERRGT